MHFSIRNVFQSERVLNSFNMVILGMKTPFYTKCMKSKYSRITNTNIKYFYSVLKNEYSLYQSIPADGSILAVTYIS